MTKNLILSREDYDLFSRFVNNHSLAKNYTIKKLSRELESAIIVERENLPNEVIRLNSEVKLNIKPENRFLSVKLVMPSSSDIKKNSISIFSPLGAALIGYQKGDTVDWEVPAGMKTFQILEVDNLNLPKF